MTSRPDADRCPGVLRPHPAVDGAVLRIRIPGGRVSAAALDVVSAASAEFADGEIQLTSRANLQLRGVRTAPDGAAPAGLVEALDGTGLLPHPTHERVRNILCSPLTGRVGGRADLRGLVDELDATICELRLLAGLPGPFLFALDDGRGDLDVLRADLAVVAEAAGRVRLWAGGVAGPVVPLAVAVPELIGLALEFGRLAATTERVCWHVREVPGGGAAVLGEAVDRSAAPPPRTHISLGTLRQDDGREAVSLLAPLGRLTGPQVTALAATGTDRLVVTPGRGIIVPDLPDAPAVSGRLVATGLVLDDESPWRGVTACPGLRCARGEGDTQALARRIVAASGPRAGLLPVHVVACPRACGRPGRPHADVTVRRERAEIRCGGAGPDVTMDRAAAVVAALRAAGER